MQSQTRLVYSRGNSSSSSNSILSRALSSMTRLCSDRATLRSKFRLRRESIYRRLCIHLSLVIRAPIPFFSLLPPLPFFRIDQKVSSPHVHFTSVSHRIQFPFFLPVPSIIDSYSNIDNVAINIAITIACLHRCPPRFLWPV